MDTNQFKKPSLVEAGPGKKPNLSKPELADADVAQLQMQKQKTHQRFYNVSYNNSSI